MRWCQGAPQASSPWRVPVAGAPSRAWRRAVGQRTPEGRRSPSFLCPPLGRSRRAPVAAMCSLSLGGFWAAGGAAPPLLAQGMSRPQAPLVACPWRVVPPTVGSPLTLRGRRRTSWMLCPPPGGSGLEALPAARARLA